MRKYKIDKTWLLALLVAFMFLVGGCDESSHAQAAIRHRTTTATATATATPTATLTATSTATATATATPTATSTPIPVVVSSNPPSTGCGGQGVPLNWKITVTFNQPMISSTINTTTFTVENMTTLVSIAGTVSYDATNYIGIFTPTSLLLPNTTYKVTIKSGLSGVESVAGGFLASDFVFEFKTGAGSNTTKPTVISTNPAAGPPPTTGVATNQKITATFSQQMDSTTITGLTFTLTGPGLTPVAGTVTYSTIGTTATFTPSSDLAASTLFTATITTEARDLAENSLAADFTWTFTTGLGPDGSAPTITLTTPASGASSVSTNASINATFSKAMDPATLSPVTFTLYDNTASTPIDGKITYDATNWMVTFTPTGPASPPLTATDSFTATITTGAKDLEGNALAAGSKPNPWSFTTGSSASLSPIDLGAVTGFEIFAEAAITNTGTNVINGDMGLTPDNYSSITGFPPGIVNGNIYVDGDSEAVAGLASLNAAYLVAAGLPGATIIAENLGTPPLTLPPGLYTSAATTFDISGGNLTLDAQGDQNAVWIFQMPSTATGLTLTTPSCDVKLVNGAQAANVFWWTPGSVTIGGSCEMVGNILAGTSISFASTGATLDGRALAGAGGPNELTGAVTIAGTLGGAIGIPRGCNQ